MRYTFKGPPPYRHQVTTFKFLLKNPAGAVLSEPGTGKTRSLVCAAEFKHLRGDSKRALFVCPAAVRHTIGREIEQWTNLSVTVLDGSSEERVEQLRSTDTYFYVTNYKSCVNIEKQLVEKGFDLIICDESTRLKSPVSQRHKAVDRIAKTCETRWISTGTPCPNNPMDLFGQFSVVDKRIFGSKSGFKQRYIKYAIRDKPWPEPVGYQNEDDLKKHLQQHSIRFLKRECLDLPPKVFVNMDFKLSPEQERIYNEFTHLLMAEMPSGEVVPIKNVMSKFIRFQQTVSGFVGSGAACEWIGPNPKLEVLMDLLDTLQVHEHKVIIWCTWVPSIEMLAAKLKDHNPALFYGGSGDQDAEIQKFNNDPGCRLMIGNSKVGIGCTMNVAPYAIYYELPYFDTEAFDQSQDRNHRIGQEAEKVTYYLLKCPGTVDYTIWRNLQGKYKFSEYVTGDDVKKVLMGLV